MTEPSVAPPVVFKIDLVHSAVNEVLKKLKPNDDSHDVCIQSDGRKFMVHRNVLMAASMFFTNILRSPAHANSKKVVINLPPSITASSVENVIHFIYSGELKVTMGNINHLRIAANLFNLQNILFLCDKYTNMHGEKKNPTKSNDSVSSRLATTIDLEQLNGLKTGIQIESPVPSESRTSPAIDVSGDSYFAQDKLSAFKMKNDQSLQSKPNSLLTFASDVSVKNGLEKNESKKSSLSTLSSSDIEISNSESHLNVGIPVINLDEVNVSSAEQSPAILVNSVRSLGTNIEDYGPNHNCRSDSEETTLLNDKILRTLVIKKEPSYEDFPSAKTAKEDGKCLKNKKLLRQPNQCKTFNKRKCVLKSKTNFLSSSKNSSVREPKTHPLNININNNGENTVFEHQDPASFINKLLQSNPSLNQYPINITFNNIVVNQPDPQTNEIANCRLQPSTNNRFFQNAANSKDSRKLFWAVVHDEENRLLFQCYFCKNVFHSVDSCAEHIKVRHILTSQSVSSCRDCKCANSSYKTVSLSSTILKCPYCQKNIPSALEKLLLCKVCGARFKNRSQLLRHMYLHHDVNRDYECSICSLKCASKWSLKMHSFSHVNNKLYECSQCSYRACTPSRLKTHSLKRHSFETFAKS